MAIVTGAGIQEAFTLLLSSRSRANVVPVTVLKVTFMVVEDQARQIDQQSFDAH